MVNPFSAVRRPIRRKLGIVRPQQHWARVKEVEEVRRVSREGARAHSMAETAWERARVLLRKRMTWSASDDMPMGISVSLAAGPKPAPTGGIFRRRVP
jgi:hypothetical protein